MRIRSVVVGALLATVCVASAHRADAFCRTVTCKLPPAWNPVDGCYPPAFASGCPSSTPPGAKVVSIWWANACVSYDIQKSASRWVDYTAAARVVNAAFAQWTGVMCPLDDGGVAGVSIRGNNLGPVDCGEVGYNRYGGPNQHVIVFRDDSWPYNDANNTLGLTTVTFEPDTGELYDADTEINGTVPLSVGDPVPPGSYDLESIVTHEMGHFLGLGHSSLSTATMYARYNPGSTSMRTLADDDVAGLCSIYPANMTRNVDPSVAAGGSKAEVPCDPYPRHGFSKECPQRPKNGCGVTSSAATGESGAEILFAALASAGVGWRRKRAPRPAQPG